MKKKYYWIVGIVVILIFFALLISYYSTFLANGDINQKTTNWKTYRNEDDGYEIKYPQDWEITADVNLKEKFGIVEENGLGINLNKVNCNFNIQKITKESYDNRENILECFDKKIININGVSLEQFYCVFSQLDYRYRYYFQKNDKYYLIEGLDNHVDIANKAVEEGKEIPSFIDNCWDYFDQMLSTFMFIR